MTGKYNKMNRRDFLTTLGATTSIGALTLSSSKLYSNTNENILQIKKIGSPLKVKPVLMYKIYQRKEAISWRPWGGLHTIADVERESKKIEEELKELSSGADFKMEVLPLTKVENSMEVSNIVNEEYDVLIVYAAGGRASEGRKIFETLCSTEKSVIVFLRHKTGPIYLWYEIIHPRFLRKTTDDYKQPNMDIWDIVVDDYNEVLWRLRSLYGLKNTIGTGIVAVNGAGGWGEGGKVAPGKAKEIWGLDIKTISMEEIKSKMDNKMKDKKATQKAERAMNDYLAQKSILSVNTDKRFIQNAFLLRDILKEYMEEVNAIAVTIQGCMGIGPIVQTTACLTLSLINDEGLMGFCESDFVVIPSGILLRYISGKPSFLNDPCFPHNGITTCAHCSAPRRMNGIDFEPTHIYTHCESDYGAAPKVEFKKGQIITNLIPDFNSKKWVGFRGKIIDSPFYDICRSQFDCEIEGDWKKLLEDMKGFHWMTCYGDYLREVEYAIKKVGIEFENISTL